MIEFLYWSGPTLWLALILPVEVSNRLSNKSNPGPYTMRVEMFQRATNLFLSLMLVTALLRGGCVACPQFFQAPIAKKSCCDPAGRCKGSNTNPSQQKPCQFQQVELQQKIKPPAPLVAAVHPVLPSPSGLLQLRQLIRAAEVQLGSLPESPHEKQALLSTFLI
jgi:hypothetical protein